MVTLKKLKFIPTKIHGVIDYAMGALLSTSPLYFKGIKKDPRGRKPEGEGVELLVKKIHAEQLIPYSMGVVSSIYSLFTNYELGAVKKIPMKVHLAIDAVNGVFMAAAPWLFGFYKKVWVPFVAIGVLEIGAALFTKTEEEQVEMTPVIA